MFFICRNILFRKCTFMEEKKKENNIYKDEEILLVQWQTCVEMANSVSERRDNMNNLFVTLNIAIITVISYMWDMKTICMSVAGIAICIVWLEFLKNFRMLNSEKFRVINEIEEKLPVQPYKEEWIHIKQDKKYVEGTKLERIFPILFIVMYTTIIIILVTKHF